MKNEKKNMMDTVSFNRQTGIFNPDNHDELVEIIGAGAIGSFTALALAKMGVKRIRVWDDDVIEPHNIPNQFYPLKFVGRPKTEALMQMVQGFSGTMIDTVNDKLEADSMLNGDIIISAVDNMDTRRMILEKAYVQGIKYLIDARMGGEVMRIYTVDLRSRNDRKLYESTLYTHAQAAKIPCSARSIIYNVMIVSGLIANQVKKVLNKEQYKKEIIFDMKTMIFFVRDEE